MTAERGKMMLDAISRETELEDVTDALLLTGNDDFNALAALALRTELGHGRVYRAAPDIDETDLLAPAGEQGILGADMLTFSRAGPAFRGRRAAGRGARSTAGRPMATSPSSWSRRTATCVSRPPASRRL